MAILRMRALVTRSRGRISDAHMILMQLFFPTGISVGRTGTLQLDHLWVVGPIGKFCPSDSWPSHRDNFQFATIEHVPAYHDRAGLCLAFPAGLQFMLCWMMTVVVVVVVVLGDEAEKTAAGWRVGWGLDRNGRSR
jgi:hypothetical protein